MSDMRETNGWLSWIALWTFIAALSSCNSCVHQMDMARDIERIASQKVQP